MKPYNYFDDEEEQPTLPANYGIYGWNVDIENSGSVSITQQNEKSEDVFGIVSEESSINNSGTVVINGNGSAVYAGGGSLTNSGSITLNGDGYGLIAEDGDLTNSGTVTLNGYGYAVLNDGGNLTNGGEIYLNGSGWGVYAKNGNLINNAGGNVTVNADDLAAISGLTLEGSGYQLQNNARIVLTSTGAKVTKTAKAIDGGDSSVVNSGNITIGSSDVLFTDSYGIYNRGSSLTNSGSITRTSTIPAPSAFTARAPRSAPKTATSSTTPAAASPWSSAAPPTVTAFILPAGEATR